VKRSILLPLVLALLAAWGTAEELDTRMVRSVWMTPKSGDTHEVDLRDLLGQSRVETIRIRADWFRGPSDDRGGDAARAEKGGFRFQISVDRTWRDLPVMTRNLRLEGEVEVPAELVAGIRARGKWSVRQVGEGERAVRVRFWMRYRTTFGKTLARPDLTFEWFVPSGRDAPEPDGGISLHDRAPVLRVPPGGRVEGKAELRNAGLWDVETATWHVILRPWSKRARGGKRLLAGELPGMREGETLGRRIAVTIPARTKPGEYALVFVLDPGNRLKELDEANNSLAFPLLVIAPEKE
jgi:hypothetical protein